jgi:Spy/CpxP family protein refolding chaperone
MKTRSLATTLLASAAFACIAAAPAMAQHVNTPGIDQAQQQIRARIQQGVASGHITQQEAQALYQREREIQFREIRMKRDGMATPEERRQLRQDLDEMRAEVESKIANRNALARYGTAASDIGNARHQIRSRIGQGMRNGLITRREADRLFSRERELGRHVAAFESDGRVTRSEQRQLTSELAMLNDDVERMMSNGRRQR